MNNSSITPFYKVKWKVDGVYKDQKFDSLEFAWRKYHSLEEADGIESVGLYYTDRNGNEKELAVWCRK